jgi:hypothetical protein
MLYQILCLYHSFKKLLKLGSFGTIVGHWVCHQIIFPISLGGLGLSLVVQCVALAFLGCWTLIALALVFHFQLDDHLTLFDAGAHVNIDISPF